MVAKRKSGSKRAASKKARTVQAGTRRKVPVEKWAGQATGAGPSRKPAANSRSKKPTRAKRPSRTNATSKDAAVKNAVAAKSKQAATKQRRKVSAKHVAERGTAMQLDSMSWALARGEYEARPLLIRFRQFPPRFAKAAYPERVNITWTMGELASTGLPTEGEQSQLATFEDRLVAAVEQDAHSVLSVVLTCDGKREWVFHTADVPGFMGRLTDMPQEEERYPIELARSEDPDWGYDDAVVPTIPR